MIFANRTVTIRAAATDDAVRETICCPTDRHHSVRMEWERLNGIRTGRMAAWCYDCRRVIPNTPTPVVITDAERQEAPGANRSRLDKPMVETADTRKRNAAIRLEWANKRTKKVELAERYGISLQRVIHIIHGKTARGERRRMA